MVRTWIYAALPSPLTSLPVHKATFRGRCATLTFQIQRMAAEVLSLAAPSPKEFTLFLSYMYIP